MKEIEENSTRRKNGEPLVYNAEQAWCEFKGYPIPYRAVEKKKNRWFRF